MQDRPIKELLLKLLSMFPPVLHRWFLARFPEPATWHQARLAFTRTTAVWSMVGHMLGLGDRHGENVLLDATTGDCVHVDFGFLFDRVRRPLNRAHVSHVLQRAMLQKSCACRLFSMLRSGVLPCAVYQAACCCLHAGMQAMRKEGS